MGYFISIVHAGFDSLPIAVQSVDRHSPLIDYYIHEVKPKSKSKASKSMKKIKYPAGYHRRTYSPTVAPTLCVDDNETYSDSTDYSDYDGYYKGKGKGKGYVRRAKKSKSKSKSKSESKSSKKKSGKGHHNIFAHTGSHKKMTKSSKKYYHYYTKAPTTRSPSCQPSTASPTMDPANTQEPSSDGTPTDFPTRPTPVQPTLMPVTPAPVPQPTLIPTPTPTLFPTTALPTELPTLGPTAVPPLTPTTTPPTLNPTLSPTRSPVVTFEPTIPSVDTTIPTSNPTTSPTDVPLTATEVDASTFFVLYDFLGTEPLPTDAQYQQAAAVTANYINDYMIAFFDFSDDTNLENVQTRINDFLNDPIRIGFDVNYRFGGDSTRIPSQQQLDNLLIQAFQQPNVQALLLALRGIPGSNPFSTVVDASYTSEDGTLFLEGGSPPVSGAGVAAIAAGCLLAASTAALIATNRAKKNGLPIFGNTNSPGDAPKMVPVSECEEDTMSECTVSVARPPSPPNRHSPKLKKIDEDQEASFTSLKVGRRLDRGYGVIPEYEQGEEEGEERDCGDDGSAHSR